MCAFLHLCVMMYVCLLILNELVESVWQGLPKILGKGDISGGVHVAELKTQDQ